MSHLVIYTACFGDHDRPTELHGLGGVADLVCFTDSPTLSQELETWTVLRRRARFKTARMDAKWYKMSATHLFPEHWWSIYLDSSVRVHQTEGFLDHCLKGVSQHPVAFYAHPEGQRTLMEEAQFSATMGKYLGEPLVEQAEHYARAGFPGGELLAGGCIVRDHFKIAGYDGLNPVSRFEKAWFDECVHWTAQDQISLPYVLWKERLRYGVLPGNIYQNEFFSRVWSGPDK